MRIFILIFFILNLCTSTVFAKGRGRICSLRTVKAIRSEVVNIPSTDKFKHCAVSCLLTLQCVSSEVIAIGIAKEILDMFTPGDADIKDIKADIKGVHLVTRQRVTSKGECFNSCKGYYP